MPFVGGDWSSERRLRDMAADQIKSALNVGDHGADLPR